MKTVFSTLCALALAGCAAQAPTPANAKTLGYWRFEGATAGTHLQKGNALADASGEGNVLKAFDAMSQPVASADEPFGSVPQTGQTNASSAEFRGNDALYTEKSPLDNFDFSPDGSNGWTLEFSFRLENFRDITRLLGRDGNAPGADTRGPLQIVATDGDGDGNLELRAEILDGQNKFQDLVASNLQARRWYNVAASASGDSFKLYVDALDGRGYQLAGEKTIGGALSTLKGPFVLGRGWNGKPADPMAGRLDEVRISDEALAPAQFLFAGQNGGVQAPKTPAAPARDVELFKGADPHVQTVGDSYWLYTTGDTMGQNNWVFFAYSSPDRKNWTKTPPILRFKEIPWIYADGERNHYPWAPALAEKDGKFYFYYAVGPQGATPSRVGVAVADSPAGPFQDSGNFLVKGGDGFEAIDPMTFVDPKSGIAYLYVGGSAGAKLRIWQLNADMVSIRREIPVETPSKFTEGPFVHYANGLYYLSYSFGGWHTPSYAVHYSTSKTPVGPWRYNGPILVSDDTRKGPGHHSFFQDPKTGQLYIAYHRWQSAKAGGDPFAGNARSLAIAPVNYDTNDEILPIEMNDDVPVLK